MASADPGAAEGPPGDAHDGGSAEARALRWTDGPGARRRWGPTRSACPGRDASGPPGGNRRCVLGGSALPGRPGSTSPGGDVVPGRCVGHGGGGPGGLSPGPGDADDEAAPEAGSSLGFGVALGVAGDRTGVDEVGVAQRPPGPPWAARLAPSEAPPAKGLVRPPIEEGIGPVLPPAPDARSRRLRDARPALEAALQPLEQGVTVRGFRAARQQHYLSRLGASWDQRGSSEPACPSWTRTGADRGPEGPEMYAEFGGMCGGIGPLTATAGRGRDRRPRRV